MAALYADENFSYPVVEELRKLGQDVLTAKEAGQAGKKVDDFAVLSYAIQLKRAVITFNRRHFKRLHKRVRPYRAKYGSMSGYIYYQTCLTKGITL